LERVLTFLYRFFYGWLRAACYLGHVVAVGLRIVAAAGVSLPVTASVPCSDFSASYIRGAAPVVRFPSQLNVANPATGAQKMLDIEDEKKLRGFYDKRLAQEVEGDALGDEFAGYVLKIMGGQDKQGFAMKQGVLTPNRVRLLLHKGVSGCRGYGMLKGERRRKTGLGCIVSSSIAVLNVIIVKKGDAEVPGLTDVVIPRRLGPKRASKIRKLFNLSKEDDVRKYVIRREVPSKKEGGKPISKAPKIQRLVTPQTLQRKRRRAAVTRKGVEASKEAAAEYEKRLALLKKEARASHRETASKRKTGAKSDSK